MMAKLDTCHCCEPAAPPAPATIYNRPGLSEVRYRIGTYGSFLQTMLHGIAGESELRRWTTRSEDDYGILVLAMWAYLADILTFYQERIANEAFLRTAVHWESVLKLVSRLDYRPAPGLAASTLLAFFTEEKAQVQIPVGLRLQSVPGQDEKPQKFETIESIFADAELNRRQVYGVPESRDPLQPGNTYGTLDPDEAAALEEELAPGQQVVVFAEGAVGSGEKRVHEATLEAVDESGWQTVVRWSPALPSGLPSGARVLRWQRKLRLFGYNASETVFVPALDETKQLFSWSSKPRGFTISSGEHQLSLESVIDGLEVGTQVLLVTPGLVHLAEITSVDQGVASLESLSDTVTQVTLDSPLPQEIDRRQAVLYTLQGNEILFWPYAYPDVVQGDVLYVRLEELDDSFLDAESIVEPAGLLETLQKANRRQAEGEPAEEGDELALYLWDQFPSAVQSQIESYDTTAPPSEPLMADLVDALNTILKSDRNLYDSQRFDHIELAEALKETALQAAGFTRSTDLRLIRVNRLLIEAAFPGAIRQTAQLTALEADRRLLLIDEQQMPEEGRVAKVYPLDTVTDGRHVVIELAQALERSLQGDRASFYGNVAEATHGETVEDEVLGNGDAAAMFQRFTLKKSPVTFVPDAEAANGAGNTLELRVNGVLWTEVETLYGQAADAAVYVTRRDEEEKMSVQFGDGRTGAWLPTGRNNVTATYRLGLGPDGNVKAGSLTTLLDRPKGLKRATNPDEARGGAEGESLEDARENAPNSVRIFDRIVSLRDFEDAARAYSGVAKARASIQWDGEQRVVELVVAGDNGARVEQQTKEDLVAYLDARRDPNRLMRVKAHRNVPVRIALAIKRDERYEPETIEGAVRDAVLDYFAFDNRDLGQPVHLSDLYRVAHDVEGVLGVDVNALQYKRSADQTAHGATADEVQEHLPLLPHELAAVTAPQNDLTLTFGLAS
jgi:hypothetical protein